MTEKRIGLRTEFIRVNCEDWQSRTMPDGYSFGGNQGWFREESDGAISPYGCGLISCADIFLYISGRVRLMQPEYMSIVRRFAKDQLRVRGKLGLNGISMGLGMSRLLREKKIAMHASWCFSKEKILPRITDMLKKDMPVCISVGPCIGSKEKIKEYGVDLFIRNGRKFMLPEWRSGLVKDHYVTVTGIIRSEGKTMLEISSWGERYYIDWAQYTAYLNSARTFFSNIMLIEPIISG